MNWGICRSRYGRYDKLTCTNDSLTVQAATAMTILEYPDLFSRLPRAWRTCRARRWSIAIWRPGTSWSRLTIRWTRTVAFARSATLASRVTSWPTTSTKRSQTGRFQSGKFRSQNRVVIHFVLKRLSLL